MFLLAAAGIVPLATMAGIALVGLAREQQAQAERAGIEITRALATAVDAELQRSVAALEAIAQSPSLDVEDLKRFHQVMRRVQTDRRDWITVTLADLSGQMLVNATLPFESSLPAVAEPASLERVLRTQRPAIGALSGGRRGTLGVPVRVPVLRDGSLRYVLTAAVKPDSFLEVLERQRIPPDWVVSIFDAGEMRVARSRQHLEYLNTPPAPTLQALMKTGDEGAGMTYVLEGERVYTAFSRSRESGWTVAIGIPRSAVEGGALRSLAAYGGGILLSIALGILAVLAIARGVNSPMAQLRTAAQALGRREELTLPETPILEIREVGSALSGAAAERAAHETERDALLRREQSARAVAEAANRAKDEFLAMLGHELRNPLGAVANATRVLEHPSIDAHSAQRALEVISRQVGHLTRLTDDLLEAGRAIMGKIVLQLEPLDLALVTARALDTLQTAGRLGTHRVQRHLQSVWVSADYTRLEQIVVNLVGNAVKFTPPGGSISVCVQAEGDEAVLSVRDTGIGMPAELRERAFELFVQGEPALDRRQGGLGIGLTLVRRLAELHGGRASADSAGRGEGSEFIVRLPAIPAPREAAARSAQTPTAAPRDVLIVEDNEDGAHSLRRLVELAGHRVRVAYDGAAGLAAALAQPPEVALIDIGLPRMDGYELARRLRSAIGRPLLLVALTGYGTPEDRSRALTAGFDEHLTKPVDAQRLGNLIARGRPSA